MNLRGLRRSALGLLLAAAGWAAGCASAPRPMVDQGFAAGAYAPARIALMPPDVFVVVDQVGDNDPAQSAALGQAVSYETVRVVEQALRARGYDVDLSARWDGIFGRDGALLIGRDELGALANSVLQFANSSAGGGQGPMGVPRFVAPELAARIGWATQSDAFLYVNVKGVTVTPGKRAASVVAAVFIVVVIAAIILAIVAQSKGGGGGGGGGSVPGGGSSWRGQPVGRAPSPAAGSAWHGTPPVAGGGAVRPPAAPAGGGGWRGGGVAPPPAAGGGWRGGGAPPPGAVVYGGPRVSVGVGVIVPLDEPVYTHDGSVGYDDPLFAGDELYVSMTLVSTYDGRILWHARDHLDLEAEQPQDIDRMVQTFLGSLPARYPPPAGAPARR